jgi:hypothetical protein
LLQLTGHDVSSPMSNSHDLARLLDTNWTREREKKPRSEFKSERACYRVPKGESVRTVPDAATACRPNLHGPIQSLDQCQGLPGSAPGLLQTLLQKESIAGALWRSPTPFVTLLESLDGTRQTWRAQPF